MLDVHGDQQSPGSGSHDADHGQDSLRGHADINTILDQIMNITDQSLDEAQVFFINTGQRFFWFSIFIVCVLTILGGFLVPSFY